MAFWLFKSEPDVWSWEQQQARGARGEPWTGVRNHQAKLNLMAMQVEDLGFFYHSQTDRAILGIVAVVRTAYPDPSAPDGSPWVAVDVVARESLVRPVGLAEIKADAVLQDMLLVRHSRLSVSPVSDVHWHHILERSRAVQARTG